jgi:hypothetical protein
MKAKCTQPKNKGQSVVEMAVMLPILLIIVVGLVEIGALLFSQMTVTNAAREGARFGAAGGNNRDITVVAQKALSATLNYDGDNTNLYVIRGKTGTDGRFDTSTSDPDADSYWWVEQTISGTTSTQSISPTVVESALAMSQTKVLIVQAFYDHKSLLGLPVIDYLADQVLLSSYTLMRMESPTVRDVGCRVYPIALHIDAINGRDPDTNMMEDILVGESPGNFGWLRWSSSQQQGSADDLEDMLRDPSLSLTTYENPDDPSDTELNVGDMIWGNTGVSAGADVRDALDDLVGAYIRVPVWDTTEGTGNNVKYHVHSFAIVKITEWDFPNLDWISAEYIGPDTVCQ